MKVINNKNTTHNTAIKTNKPTYEFYYSDTYVEDYSFKFE
jgi:hypothetical protein